MVTAQRLKPNDNNLHNYSLNLGRNLPDTLGLKVIKHNQTPKGNTLSLLLCLEEIASNFFLNFAMKKRASWLLNVFSQNLILFFIIFFYNSSYNNINGETGHIIDDESVEDNALLFRLHISPYK